MDRPPHPPDGRATVVVAGAGIAGLEAALALREFAGGRARVEVLDPRLRFRVPATATGRAFGIEAGIEAPVAGLVGRAGAVHRRGHLVGVDPRRRRAILSGGEPVRYDHLIVAVGARAEAFVPNALTFTGHREAPELKDMVEGVALSAARGEATDLVVAVPPACGWPVPAYEIAMLARDQLVASGHGDGVRVTVVTAEDRPLGVFGPAASDTVGRILARAGVRVRTGAVVRGWSRGGLELAGDEAVPADRVVALPVLRGPAIDGLPADRFGFLRTGSGGRVPGAPGVWVAGDATTFPVKQGGIACQQADAAASAIARELGADIDELPFEPVLRGWVWDGAGGRFLRTALAGGRGESAGLDDGSPLWWPVAKVAGRFLTPFLHDLPPGLPLTDLTPAPSPRALA
ncbi:MAG: NAD(P)/FAD-dependent oxidoreductase [Thermoleophilia bacterium]